MFYIILFGYQFSIVLPEFSFETAFHEGLYIYSYSTLQMVNAMDIITNKTGTVSTSLHSSAFINHCCSRRAINDTYSECVFVGFEI
jgi:hypothetical protein